MELTAVVVFVLLLVIVGVLVLVAEKSETVDSVKAFGLTSVSLGSYAFWYDLSTAAVAAVVLKFDWEYLRSPLLFDLLEPESVMVCCCTLLDS